MKTLSQLTPAPLVVPVGILISLLVPAACSAQSFTLSLDSPDVVVTTKTDETVTFYGTLTNTDTSALYFNGDLLAADPPLSFDDSLFINTFVFPTDPGGNPLSQPTLGAGQSVDAALFTVSIPQGTALGTYGGSFQVQGGFTTNDYGVLGKAQPFTLTASENAPPPPAVPEAPPMLTLSLMMATVGVLVVRKKFGVRAA